MLSIALRSLELQLSFEVEGSDVGELHIDGDPMGRGGFEPPTLGLKVPCSTS
jgi:hypothetical protein